MENWFLRICQLLVMFSVGSAAIYWQWTDNKALVGAWGLIAAIAFTVVYGKIADTVFAVRNGAPLPFPPVRSILYVSGVTLGVIVAMLVTMAIALYLDQHFHFMAHH